MARPYPHSQSRRVLLRAGMLGILTALALPKAPSAQSHGAVTISIDESLGSVFGLARIFINDEPQGVLSAGCCMYLQVAAGTHDLTLRWSDHEVTAEFTSNGIDTIAFHLTAERALILLEE